MNSLRSLLMLAIGLTISGNFLYAQENPLSGYSGYTNYYSLDYVNGTGFGPYQSGDVQVKINIGGIAGGATSIDSIGGVTLNSIDVDTGSRGLFLSADTLGSYGATNANSFAGIIDLTSSKRVYTGYYTPTAVNFNVTDQNNAAAVATAYIPVLSVQSLGSESNGSATYTAKIDHGRLNLDDGGTLDFTGGSFTLSNGQSVSYSNNAGILPSVSNFGIGFFVGGNTTTGPVGNNTNQIYNAFLNLTNMVGGSMVSGYIIKEDKIQLGLTANTTNFAYTQLAPTGLSSTNSVPDWKPSRGEVVVNGATNGPGEIILDTGIGYAFAGLTNPTGWNDGSSNSLTINLLNSTNVGYNFNVKPDKTTDPTLAGPNSVSNYVSASDTFYNSGRNIFNAFDMLYDGQNGYMGLITNTFGATNPNIFFQSGFYPDPVPEPATCSLIGLSMLVLVIAGWRRRECK